LSCERCRMTPNKKVKQKKKKKILETLTYNNFPRAFIKQIMDKTTTMFNSVGPRNVRDPKTKFISLPYDTVPFNRIKSLLGKYNFKVAAKPIETVGDLFFTKLKDKIPKEFLSNVVYSITCTCEEQYIGNTGQWMKTRFQQHKSRDENHSALSKHLHETKHEPNFDNMEIICFEKSNNIRAIKEMVHIKHTNNMNHLDDCLKLGSTFDTILSKCM